MPAPVFRLVCSPAALGEDARAWARELLAEGEVALLLDGGGLDAVDNVAHTLGMLSVPVLRREVTPERQEETVIAYAAALPLVWAGGPFSERVTGWARGRGPMTLLVETADGALPSDEQGRIARFVASLGRQSE